MNTSRKGQQHVQDYEPLYVRDSTRAHFGDVTGHIYNSTNNYYHPAVNENFFPRQFSKDDSDSDSDTQESLPRGWEAAASHEGDVYYVKEDDFVRNTGTTTWVKPMDGMADPDVYLRKDLKKRFAAVLQPEPTTPWSSNPHVSTDSKTWFYDEVASRPGNSDKWPGSPASTDSVAKNGRCSLYTEGMCIWEHKEPLEAVRSLIDLIGKGTDSICIIENINEEWIQALGAARELALPYDFFLRQANNTRVPGAVGHNSYMSSMDDIVQRALSLQTSLQRKKKEESMKKVVETLCLASIAVKTSVENCVLCGTSHKEIDRVTAYVAECDRLLARLKEEAASQPRTTFSHPKSHDTSDRGSISVRALRRQMMNLDFVRLRRFFNLYATYEFEEHVPHQTPLKCPSTTFFQRNIRPATGNASAVSQDGSGSASQPQRYSLDTQLSYIRVDKSLCLILVDPQPDTKYLAPGRPGRSKVNANFTYACAGQGFTVPGLLESRKSTLYDTLKLFTEHAWHAEILCGEQRLPPTYLDYLDANRVVRTGRPGALHSKLHTALDPQAFLLTLSSFVWERNLAHLEGKLNHLSFRWLRNASTMQDMGEINDILHDSREDLGALVSQVQHTLTHMPAYLVTYYENFPRIRHRHKATHFSPVEHLPTILKRAGKLDKLILDDFQILMSSVSVREGHDSTKQTKLATAIAVIAFTYVPLTLVTGIFGMNITGADKGFAWWAPLVALVVVIAFTGGLLAVAYIFRAVRRQWRKEKESSSKPSKRAAFWATLKDFMRKAPKVVGDEEADIAKTK